jgi:hypothetical protein
MKDKMLKIELCAYFLFSIKFITFCANSLRKLDEKLIS